MLRRNPTRIPLKNDDIEEYEELLREKRELEMGDGPNKTADSFASQRSSAKRKKSVAERIGLKGKR